MFNIIIHDDKGAELETIHCTVRNCTIGRSGKNVVQLKGWRIAGTHVKVDEKGDGIYVTDFSSGIGTKVNGDKVTTYGPLLETDVVAVGAYRLSILSEKQQQPVDSAPVAVLKEETQEVVSEPVQEEEKEDPGHSLRTNFGVRQNSADEFVEPVRDEHRFIWHKRIHEKLMGAMDLRRTDVESMNDEQLTGTVKALVNEIIGKMDRDFPPELDRSKLAKEVIDEAIGLGPLEDFLANDAITEIMVNRYDDIYYETRGKLHKSNVTFSSDNAVLSVIERIVSPLGRRIDESSPMVDGRLKDGSRVNAIIPPLAIHGPCLTIRKFSRKKLTTDDFIGFGSISPRMVDFLHAAVHNRKNIIISGEPAVVKPPFSMCFPTLSPIVNELFLWKIRPS